MNANGIILFGRKIPAVFFSGFFLAVLGAKLAFSALFASDVMTRLFIPFLQYFAQNPFANPYQHFFTIGVTNAFPYPPAMLFIMGVPFLLLGPLAGAGVSSASIFVARLPILVADLAIFYVLCRLFEGKEEQVSVLYWASPVIFYINYVHGQLDAIPIALLVISIYMLFAKREKLSFAFLALGLAAKSNLFIVLPLYFFYLMKRKVRIQRIAGLFALAAVIYALLLSPYLFSQGFEKMVFQAPEQFRLLALHVPFGPELFFYIVPALYLYIMFKAYSFKKITKDVFFMTVGVMFTMLVTLITPQQGWYLWCIPFIAYFFIKFEELDPLIYHAFGITYLLYFALIPASDIFNVFQVFAPSFALHATPYAMLEAAGVDAGAVVSLAFTALTSTLIYITYQIYKRGIKNSLLFQEKNGIPAIGISGDSGAGKTRLSGQIAELFGKGRANVIYGDDVHKWERGNPNWSRYTHLNPVANYINYNYDQIRSLKHGKEITRPAYDHSNGKFTKPMKIAPREFIISEGLHTFFIPEASSIYELKVYLDPDPTLRRLWKIRRDVESRDYSVKKALEQVKRREDDAEKFVKKQKERSDVIVSFMPSGKSLAVRIDLRTGFSVDPLISALSCCSGLSVSHEYLDESFQRITVAGGAAHGEIATAAATRLGVDLEDYGIGSRGFASGLDGAVQMALLYCLNEKLRALSSTGD